MRRRAVAAVLGQRARERVLDIFRRLTCLPGIPVELVQQHFGEVALPGRAAAKGQIEPVEILPPVLGRDIIGRGSRLVTAGAIDEPQMLRLAQEPIYLAAFEIGAFDAERGIAVVVVGRVQQAVPGGDQGQQPVPFDRQFVLAPVERSQAGPGPRGGKILERLGERLPAREAVGHGGGRAGTAPPPK